MLRTTLALLLIVSTASTFILPQSQSSSLTCLTCIATVKGVEPLALAEGDAVAEHEVKQLCLKEAPTPAAEKTCEEYGDEAIEVMISLIKKGVPPKTICQQLKKC
ncbi:unnamed protein product [Caenorhabditis brenneri]